MESSGLRVKRSRLQSQLSSMRLICSVMRLPYFSFHF
jgi:hypothetical protein